MFRKLGPDAGFDSISDQGEVAAPLNALLDAFEQEHCLPRTIIYNLNPVYNELIGTTIQNFQAEKALPVKSNLVQAGGLMIQNQGWFAK